MFRWNLLAVLNAYESGKDERTESIFDKAVLEEFQT